MGRLASFLKPTKAIETSIARPRAVLEELIGL